jgi:hypothetical protein
MMNRDLRFMGGTGYEFGVKRKGLSTLVRSSGPTPEE